VGTICSQALGDAPLGSGARWDGWPVLGPPWGKLVVRPWVKEGRAVTTEDLAGRSVAIWAEVWEGMPLPASRRLYSVDEDPRGDSGGGRALWPVEGELELPGSVAGADASCSATAGV
jgi:hypothetical protein